MPAHIGSSSLLLSHWSFQQWVVQQVPSEVTGWTTPHRSIILHNRRDAGWSFALPVWADHQRLVSVHLEGAYLKHISERLTSKAPISKGPTSHVLNHATAKRLSLISSTACRATFEGLL